MSSNNFDKPWFYEEIIDINNENKFEFNKENLHYCKKVLRINKNSKILIFDGYGNSKIADISFNGKKVIFNNIKLSKTKKQKFNFSVVQSLCEVNKLELVIQKVTELGCEKLFLTNSAYSKKFDIEFLEKNFQDGKKLWPVPVHNLRILFYLKLSLLVIMKFVKNTKKIVYLS